MILEGRYELKTCKIMVMTFSCFISGYSHITHLLGIQRIVIFSKS